MTEKTENQEVSVISHLLEVEKHASAVITAANLESDKKIQAAKIAAENEKRSLYTAGAAKLQENFESDKKNMEKSHSIEMETYKKTVEEMQKNQKGFEAVLNKVLF